MTYAQLDSERNEFRLLHIAPADNEDKPISCRFSIASHDDAPSYEALSYVWGTINDKPSIHVDGRRFEITANLHSALKHLRLHSQERVVWADALCINQHDTNERTQQVSRMTLIYSNASRVVVWLGPGWSGSDAAMDFLRKIAADPNLHLDPTQTPSITVNGLGLDSPDLRSNLIQLFDLPWWKRTWTIQEFVLAQNLTFQCGKAVVSQNEMYMSRENFWAHKDRCCSSSVIDTRDPKIGLGLGYSFSVPARLDFISKTRGAHYSVLTPISTFCTRGVTDPRDRVYGMLGLGTGPYANLIEPDYTLTCEEICSKLAMMSVQRTGMLEFLSHLFPHQNPKLPSFVPNWTGQFEWVEAYSNRLGNINFFSASLDTVADVKLVSRNMLMAKGVIFDTIETVSDSTLFDNSINTDALEEMFEMAGLQNSESLDMPYPDTEETRLLAFWKSLCGGFGTDLRDNNRFRQCLKESTDLSKFFKLIKFLTASSQARRELWDNELELIVLDVQSGIQGRHFFTTRKGYFGFGPARCLKGDMVVLLAGGKVPYIIRPVSRIRYLQKLFGALFLSIHDTLKFCTRKRCSNILGDAYVHGIMDGEAFPQTDDTTRRQLREIVLV